MRYLKLLFTYFKVNLKSLAVYDLDFYFAIIGMIVQNVLNIVALRFIFNIVPRISRSEERRVGKECSSRWSLYHLITNDTTKRNCVAEHY